MIQRLLLATLLLACALTTANAQYTSVRPPSFDRFTVEVDWANATTVYVAARSNPGGSHRSAILKSGDAGLTWTQITRDAVNYEDMDVIDDRTLIAVGQSGNCICASIQRTSDGGQNFDEVTFPGIARLMSIDMVDSSLGYAVGDAGAIMKTTNGGGSWTNIGPGVSESVSFLQVSFASADTGYATAMYTANPDANRVYKTVNGGTTWSKIVDRGIIGSVNDPVFHGLWAVDGKTVFLAGREIIRTIVRSTDGGTTWSRVYSGLPTPEPLTMNQVEFVNDTVGFAAGDFGNVLRTTNGGLFWNKEDAGTETALWGLGFRDRNTGIVGGLAGELVRRTTVELPTVAVDPSSLNFGAMTEGSKDLTVTVSPANGAGLVITGIRVDDPDAAGFELVDPVEGFPMELEQGDEQTITVRFTPEPGLNDRVFGALVISTNDEREPDKSVTLVADASVSEEAPTIAVSASNLDFGSIVEDNTKDLTLEISAGTEAPLELDSLWIHKVGPGGEAFQVVSPSEFPVSIVPGTPQVVTIRYAPTEKTEFAAAAELVILSNDPDNTELRVALEGSATEAPLGIEDEALRSALAITTSPNPVTGQALVSMNLPAAGHLVARLFDARGVAVATLVDGQVSAGATTLRLDGTSLGSGAYTMVVTLDGRTVTTRVTVTR